MKKLIESMAQVLNEKVSGYPWSEAPRWARYAVMNAAGGCYWFSHEPVRIKGNAWTMKEAGSRSVKIGQWLFDGPWADSVESRP